MFKKFLLLGSIVISTGLFFGCNDGTSSSSENTSAVSKSALDKNMATCGPIKVASLDDDSHRAQIFAIMNGQIKSDLIPEVKVEFLQIPALIQASMTGQYDILTTALSGIVHARQRSGKDLRIVGLGGAHMGHRGMALYVRADSNIKTPQDLRGRTLGAFSFGSSALVETQIVLTEKYGYKFSLDQGDIRWLELDPPTLLNAIRKGDVDGGLLYYQTGWLAENDSSLRKIAQIDADYVEVTNGAHPVGSAFIADGSWIRENQKCLFELQRMMDESIAYAVKNIDTFSGEIAAQTGVPADFVEFWWNPENYTFVGTPNHESIGWIQKYYDLAYKYGNIPVNPNVAKDLVVTEKNPIIK